MEKILDNAVQSVSSAAMVLAMTASLSDEEDVKRFLAERGYIAAATEIGGNTSCVEFQAKMTRALLGACLNGGLIEKVDAQLHAVLHAAEEAKRGVAAHAFTGAHVSLKIAVVRRERWLAVALFGDAALHHMTNHQRAGLGVMHI